MKAARILIDLLIVVVVLSCMIGAYALGLHTGETNVIEQMHISNIVENGDSYDVVFAYKDNAYIHVYTPWWEYMTAEEAFR